MCVRLDLLAESGRRRLEIGSWNIYIDVNTCDPGCGACHVEVGEGGIQYGVVGIDSQAVDA
jgi:hypothetical protein